ncbi:hypothetical protein [Azospirillum canadense]|uniref:hypothetical protein n=1 Tax=Azospirillum canadense TaxID=403962 RepID=UPI0022261282|nr:hypothetical protein [Azospirillum canadense]MCW2240361.1 hypothetical protein [Azospirillum canadense]
MPFLLVILPFAIIAYVLAVPPAAPAPPATDQEAFATAVALLETHQAALTYAATHPAAAGAIPATGTPSLTTYRPPGWIAPNGVTIVSCIGSPAEHRAVATWASSLTTLSASRIARALATQAGQTSDAGLINVNPVAPAEVVPPAATPTSTFPSATCAMPASPTAVFVTHTLP